MNNISLYLILYKYISIYKKLKNELNIKLFDLNFLK